MLYFRIKKKLKNRSFYDVWYDDKILVHYNYYSGHVEIKMLQGGTFTLLYETKVFLFMKVNDKYKNILKYAF